MSEYKKRLFFGQLSRVDDGIVLKAKSFERPVRQDTVLYLNKLYLLYPPF